MSAIAQQESLVKESLFQFINKSIPSADLSAIDDIVLSYVISILEEASQDPCFDVEGFIEMMDAYVPQFAHIDAARVLSWVLELEAELTRAPETPASDDSSGNDKFSVALQSLSEMLPSVKPSSRSHSSSESSEDSGRRGATVDEAVGLWDEQCAPLHEMFPNTPVMEQASTQASQQASLESSEDSGRRGATVDEAVGLWDEQCAPLHEMFPNTPVMEIKHCISIAHGDLERAAATLLHRREQGQALSAASLHAAQRAPPIDDHELKSRIIARYSYVDKNSEAKEHKPLAPKIEPKKMVRYRDNKIVSLKGERYTEVPKSGVDEENLKKPKRQHCP